MRLPVTKLTDGELPWLKFNLNALGVIILRAKFVHYEYPLKVAIGPTNKPFYYVAVLDSKVLIVIVGAAYITAVRW